MGNIAVSSERTSMWLLKSLLSLTLIWWWDVLSDLPQFKADALILGTLVQDLGEERTILGWSTKILCSWTASNLSLLTCSIMIHLSLGKVQALHVFSILWLATVKALHSKTGVSPTQCEVSTVSWLPWITSTSKEERLAFLKHGLPNLVIKSLTPAKGMQITMSDEDTMQGSKFVSIGTTSTDWQQYQGAMEGYRLPWQQGLPAIANHQLHLA